MKKTITSNWKRNWNCSHFNEDRSLEESKKCERTYNELTESERERERNVGENEEKHETLLVWPLLILSSMSLLHFSTLRQNEKN